MSLGSKLLTLDLHPHPPKKIRSLSRTHIRRLSRFLSLPLSLSLSRYFPVADTPPPPAAAVENAGDRDAGPAPLHAARR